jgi:Type III secretory pathway, component EscT
MYENEKAYRRTVPFMNKGRVSLIAVAVILPTLLFSFLPIALAQLLIRPGDFIASPLASKEIGAFIAIGTLISWAMWAAALALVIGLGRILYKRSKVILMVLVLALAAMMAVQIPGSRNTQFEGIWESGFEHSDFFVSGNCDRPRYWLRGSEEFYGRIRAFDSPTAVRVKFVGTTTRMGSYGHLGQYLREVQVEKIISVEPARPCIHR